MGSIVKNKCHALPPYFTFYGVGSQFLAEYFFSNLPKLPLLASDHK
jgi:hypothetical protein